MDNFSTQYETARPAALMACPLPIAALPASASTEDIDMTPWPFEEWDEFDADLPDELDGSYSGGFWGAA